MRKLISVFLVPFLFFLFAVNLYASTDSLVGKIVSLEPTEVVEGNYYAVGETLEILGTVNGDVYAAGDKVYINGVINGDLLVAGGVVNMAGVIKEDARVVGGQIINNADVGGNVSLVGGDVDLSSASKVGEGLQIISGNTILSGFVNNEAKVVSGNVNINGEIGKDLQARVGSLRLSPSARIGDRVEYWSNQEALVDQSASISGEVKRHETFNDVNFSSRDFRNALHGLFVFTKLSSILTTLLFGLLVTKLFPKFSENTAQIINNRFWQSLGVGLAGFVLIPVICLILAFTLIGIPVSIILILLTMVGIYIARIFAIIALGAVLVARFAKKENKESLPISWVFLTGASVYYILSLVPFFGEVLKFIILIAGFGGSLISKKITYSLAREKKII